MRMGTYRYVYIYIHMCMCIYIYIYMYIYIYIQHKKRAAEMPKALECLPSKYETLELKTPK
jgi:hypothetical protein